MLTRILRTQAVTLSHVFDPDEVPTGATGSVGYSLNRLDGTVVTAGNATGPDENQSYYFTYAGSATLDRLTLVWTATVGDDVLTLDQDRVEVVGGHLFGLAEARGYDKLLANNIKYPTTLLKTTRNEVEDEAESICECAFVPRFERELLDGTGEASLRLMWPLTRVVRKVSVTNTFGDPLVDFDADQLLRVAPGDDGVLRLDSGFFWTASNWTWGAFWPLGRRNVLVEYEHGLDGPPPSMNRAGKQRLKSLLLEATAALPDRAEGVAITDTGTVVRRPDADSTGIPAVDAIYARQPRYRPSFG